MRARRARSKSTPAPSAKAEDRAVAAVGVPGFTRPGSRPLGCLLIHGFTATPDEVRPLADALAQADFPVRALRLPGHATTVDDLATVGWRDWVAAVDAELSALQTEARWVAVGGVSLGAMLALHAAARSGSPIRALVLAAPPFVLADWRPATLPWLQRLPGVTRRLAVIPKRHGRDIADPEARARSRSYDAMPLAAVLGMLELRRMVRGELAHVTQPALLLHGRLDHTVSVRSQEFLRRALGSRWIETHVLDRSAHVVTEDFDRATAARLVIDFLGRVEAACAAPTDRSSGA